MPYDLTAMVFYIFIIPLLGFCCQVVFVRCPGHTIHYMVFGYEEFVRRVLQLTGLAEQEDRREYESWDPYRLQDPEKDQS